MSAESDNTNGANGLVLTLAPYDDDRNWMQRHLVALVVTAFTLAIAAVIVYNVVYWDETVQNWNNNWAALSHSWGGHVFRYLWSFPVDLYHWTNDTALPWINEHIFGGRWHRTAS